MAKRQQPGCGCCGGSPGGGCTAACSPCAIPTADLTLTRTPGPFVSTLVYDSTGGTWSDGSYTLACSGGTTTLSGPGGPWFQTTSTCSPYQIKFGAGSVIATIDGGTTTGSVCCQTFIVFGCNTNLLSGVLVRVYDSSGGTLLASGTTGAAGRVTLLWTKASSPCSVWVDVSRSRFTTSAASYTLSASGETEITLSPTASYVCSVCCTASAIPQPRTLFLTDANGTYSLTYTSSGGTDYWYACTTATANPTITVGSPCVAGGSASIPIYYAVSCASSNSWAVNRQWGEARPIGSGPWYYFVDASCGALGISGGGCIGISIGGAQRQAMTFDCTAIAFSNTLTKIGGNLADPVGGTVTVSE